jgi:hypothetical protein
MGFAAGYVMGGRCVMPGGGVGGVAAECGEGMWSQADLPGKGHGLVNMAHSTAPAGLEIQSMTS